MNTKKVIQSLRPLIVFCCLLLAPSGSLGQEGAGQPAAKPAAKKAAAKRAPQAAKPRKKADAGEAETKVAGEQTATIPQETAGEKPAGASKEKSKAATVAAAPGDEALKSRLEEIQKLPAWERVAELEDFLDGELPDAIELRALEHLVSSLAAFADERLTAGDSVRGVELFKQAVGEAPADMTDKLFADVVAQFPGNLYLRGQREAAFDIARRIERRVKDNPKRLLALVPFYLGVERADEAGRVAAAAVKLAPALPAAHLALGAALRQSLRLAEAEREYARALELDPKSAVARQSLADLRRGAGRAEEALALYRELLAADPKNGSARNGIVLSLFDAGRRADAERELEAALKDDPKNLPLLAGAAYWHAARGDSARALDLAGRAVRIEPRHPWAQVALARALVAAKRPLDAERALRFARLHSRFPTLDYELANALASAGLYEEAAETLARSFTLKGGRVSARLAGHVEAAGDDFVELLAPERRASFFQSSAAETAENARRLKALLSLHTAARAAEQGGAADEGALASAATEFARGEDEMRSFRHLYAANRLLRRRAALPTALELVESARKGVEAGLDAPHATVAALADELRDARANAIAQGGTPDIPAAPRNVLSNVVGGRIEEAHGWTLYNQGKVEEAIAALRRAVSVLPESSVYWRSAQWRLGVALASSGNNSEALASYIRAYDPNRPDPARRAVLTALYRKVYGSTTGLDVRLPSSRQSQGAAAGAPVAGEAQAQTAARPQPETVATPAAEIKVDEAKPSEVEKNPVEAGAKKGEAEAKKSEAKKSEDESAARTVTPAASEPSPSPTPLSTPTPEAAPAEAAAAVTPSPSASPSPEPSPSPVDKKAGEEATPAPAAAKTAEGKNAEAGSAPAAQSAAGGKPRRTRSTHPVNAKCALAVSAESLSLASGGGSGTVVARLEGGGDLARLTATTPNWSDIIVLREPQGEAEADAARFTISSISKTTGTFTVAIKSPCGTKEIGVTVK